jgi:predicted esterase
MVWGMSLLILVGTVAAVNGQDFSPPASRPPDEATLKEITEKTARLGKMLVALRRESLKDPWLAEIEVFHRAALWIVNHNEFYQPDSAAWTVEALHRGMLRASLVAQGQGGGLPWLGRGYTVVRGYRSKIDGSVQPYAVTLPEAYGKDSKRKWRLDVVLHGRDTGLTEVKFLHQHNGDTPPPKDQDFVRLDIFGRGNNAYRWAGEADVLEVLAAFSAVEAMAGRGELLDPARLVLRGFSMGGAGTWHLGLHQPSRWCVLGPGAGFTATHGYVPDLPETLPDWQEKCLRIYDAVDYAENLFDVPAVAYAGTKDPQLDAARSIEGRLKGADFPFQLKVLTAPGLGHKFPPEWQAKAQAAYAPIVTKGRPEYPARVRFVTWTMRYAICDWVEILALDHHYQKSLVDAEKTETGFSIKTANVRSLHLTLPPGASHEMHVDIDSQKVAVRPLLEGGNYHVFLQRRGKSWHSVRPERLLTDAAHHPRKHAGLQGPIDDAFTAPFLCVRGTAPAWTEFAQKYPEACLERFSKEWSRFWRGDLPIKDDQDVTSDDIASKHLILFGDPASNSLIAQVLDGLPLTWTRKEIRLAGKTYSSADHIPVLIYPSPLNASRYVVLNSGHTFPTADYLKTNALLYPRLGDYAMLGNAGGKDVLAVEVATAGLFDDGWQLGKK